MEIITPRPDLEHVIKLYGSFLRDYDYLMRTFGANRAVGYAFLHDCMNYDTA